MIDVKDKILVKFQTRKGETIENQAYVIDEKYVHMGIDKPLYCCCTGETEETATPMQYNTTNDTVFCPNCHEHKVDVIKTRQDYQEERAERKRKQQEKIDATPLKLVNCTNDYEALGRLYRLNKRISPEDWKKVAQYFSYHNPHDFIDLSMVEGNTKGWMTLKQNIPKIEEILGIAKEVKVSVREEKNKKLQKEVEEIEEEIKENNKKLADKILALPFFHDKEIEKMENDKFYERRDKIKMYHTGYLFQNGTFYDLSHRLLTYKENEVMCVAHYDDHYHESVRYTKNKKEAEEIEELIKEKIRLEKEEENKRWEME